MENDRESKTIELNRLYDLYWKTGSELDRALVKTKIRIVTAELDRMEMTGAFMPT